MLGLAPIKSLPSAKFGPQRSIRYRATPTSTAPIDVIRTLDTELCAAYNAGKVAAAAHFYNPEADIIPADAMSVIKGVNASEFFAAQIASGVIGLHLEPLTVAPDNDHLYHEIGNATHALNPGGSLYYVRWFYANDQWQIAMDAKVVSGGWRVGGAHATPSNATKIVQSMDNQWAASYNKGDFAAVADLYSSQGSQEWARLVAPLAHDFLQPNAAFFSSMHDPRQGGVSSVQLTPTLCVQEGGSLIHEIGRMATMGSTGTNKSHAYYHRWERPEGSWLIALDIMSIGE